jgi:hypothetical protein
MQISSEGIGFGCQRSLDRDESIKTDRRNTKQFRLKLGALDATQAAWIVGQLLINAQSSGRTRHVNRKCRFAVGSQSPRRVSILLKSLDSRRGEVASVDDNGGYDRKSHHCKAPDD